MTDTTFAVRLESFGTRLAIVADDGCFWSYAQLAAAADRAATALQGPRQLVIVEAANRIECVCAYLACLRRGWPVVLAEPGSTARDSRIADTFQAGLVFRENEDGGWAFQTLPGAREPALHPELCLLLSTSGSTGSPKLVRLSLTNIEKNAQAIAEYLGILTTDKAITALPLFYSYGMSVLNSHLAVGATVLLSEYSVAQDEFWQRFETEGATSLAGVPFSFDVLERIGFRQRRYPALRYLTQAGGRLPAERVLAYAEWARAQGKQMFVMYGQTEAAPRMAYVPPAQLHANPDCIGVPVPGGAFELVEEDGTPVTAADQPGELVYRGPNVMMGYAESAADLARGAGPAELRTGDLACRKANGNYYIVGRKSRFSKILGLRISLDEIERWLEQRGVYGAVGGDDKLIAVAMVQRAGRAELKQALLERFGLPASAVEVRVLDPLPTLPSGKVDHRAVLRLVRQAAGEELPEAPRSLLEAYSVVLGVQDVRPEDSFLDLDGDSVSFVDISLLIESYLGHLPENWEARSIAELEALKLPAAAAREEHRPRRFAVAAMVAFSLLAVGEASLQMRHYLKTGRSAAALLTGSGAMVFNKDWGLTTYRPHFSRTVLSNGGRFDVNSLGFRSPEIAAAPQANELRVVVAGASTVSGAYAATNQDTFPSLLEQRLRQQMPSRPVNVVNAGIEGYTLDDIERLVERALIGLKPAAVVIYPGFNDMSGICRAARSHEKPAHAPQPSLPRWMLTREILAKNTVSLREPPVRAAVVDPAQHMTDGYAARLDAIVGRLQSAGIVPVLMTVARATKHERQPGSVQLAQTALFYNPCLDLAGLLKASAMYNRAIANVARQRRTALVDLARAMPGGRDYFVDGGHFTARGERFTADYLFRSMYSQPELARGLGIPQRMEVASGGAFTSKEK
ncbi:AMP-binding protein [Massilia sp. NR 4-1]|uniref:AMP-binding protein n=1 Tax=Massilia sp. NR 4-1 TaxID=1678028 RepID=UPI0009E1AD06|nr:AMP-binding protein [Massilia sp. NR 4-1]